MEVVYRRGLVRAALIDAACGLLCVAVLWVVVGQFFHDPLDEHFGALLAPVGMLSIWFVGLYVRDRWLVRTSYHGLDLIDGERVRIPWAAIDGLSVRRRTLRVSVGRPGDVTNIIHGRWRARRSEYTVTTPEIEALVADLATRLPYLTIARDA